MTAAQEALERLREGNARFAAGLHGDGATKSLSRRDEVAKGQEPFAIILGCSDSRVPAEIVFDQGLGDLFVIRNDRLIVVGAEYSLETGEVEFFDAGS